MADKEEKKEKTEEEKKKEAEEEERKEVEKEKKAKRKWMDEDDDNFCGFLNLQIVDSDGYAKKTKGMAIERPLYMTSGSGSENVTLEAEIAMNPLFFIQVPNEDSLLLHGTWWIGEKSGSLSNIGSTIPKMCTAAHKDMEKSSSAEFKVDVEMPLLKGAPSRLVNAVVTTKEQKFVTKVTKVTLDIPRQSWKEWKEHRCRFWQFGKNQGGAGVGGGGKKDEEKKE